MKTDPKRLFDDADRLRAPDLWSDIATRAPRPSVDPSPTIAHRGAAAIVALLIAASGFALAVHALGRSSSGAASSQPSGPSISYSPEVAATLDIGPRGQTNAIVAGAGSIWVTAYGMNGGGGV